MTRRKKLLLAFFTICLSAAFFAQVHFYYNAFFRPLQLYAEAIKSKPFDAIIVPGIPSDGGTWGFIMKWRMYWSLYLFQNGIAKNVIYSGGAVYTPYTEAVIMALYAEKMGIPADHIFVETKAEHTTENLYYSYELAKEKGFKTIGFATDPFQTMKIGPYINKFKLDVQLIPMIIPKVSGMKMKDYGIESYKAYKLHFISIRERETEEEQQFYSKGGRIKIEE